MSNPIIWFDPDEWIDAAGVLIHGGMARNAGVEICYAPAKNKDSGLARALAEKGLHLLDENDKVSVSWYALPRLYVFARDDSGFYAADEPVDMDSAAPVYHVSDDWSVTRAASNPRSLADALLAGEPIERTPDDTHRLFASWRAAEEAGELFLRNDTPWRRGKV